MTNEELINKSVSVINKRKLTENSSAGGVGAALLTAQGKVYSGVCIDTSSGMGFCAEHAAIAAMITHGEQKIKKLVATWKDENGGIFIIPPCGRCREFMKQIDNQNLEAEILIAPSKSVKLKELLPFDDSSEKVS